MIRLLMMTGVLLLLGIPVQAHEGSVIYPIYELPPSHLPDLHDGTLAEWEEALPNASLTHNDFWSLTGEQELPFRIFLAWSLAQQQIYVGLERLDTEVVDGREMFAIEVDGDHSGGLMWDADPSALALDDLQVLVSNGQRYQYQPQGDEREVFGFGDEWLWSRTVPFMEVGIEDFGEDPNHLILEMALTLWDKLDREGADQSRRTVLGPGTIIGFQISMIDSGKDDFGLYAITESLPDERYKAGAFVDGQLIPCNLPGCSQTSSAVRQDSWARIKASVAE